MPRATHPTAGTAPLDLVLVAVGRGDSAAFVELYDAVAPRVHGLALRVLRDPHQAEEVTQEVLLELWRSGSRYDPARGSALAWTMTVAHRRAVDRVRSSEAGRRRDATWDDRSTERSPDDAFEVAHSNEKARTVRGALASLTPVQREAIELAYYGGRTHAEVAQLMCAPLGTTKTRIRDGLARLRDRLAVPVAEPA
ncbi:ECF RNA polymerase sigma factor SigK [Nocardioides sp. Soil805]|uniref:ECF RNA polymerase sigma factor SigK n=1 Tax=Nocardioides sp. Soil805 TaxID=1736416 RepID=UPI0007028AA7|nr:ECF RNA polymerase sigma factor SigK [Nocardioides sp. Soil805]KRF35160.1 RNA polymerase subunit sigma [Nocardioides sp. Soil805]